MTEERIEELFQKVMHEACKDPLRRFAELVAADERERIKQEDQRCYVERGRTEPKSDFKNQMDDNWSGIV